MANPLILVLTPTFSQTIEQRICLGIYERLQDEDVKLLFAPLDYLPVDADELQNRFWVHTLLNGQRPDLLLMYGGGLGYASGFAALHQILALYPDVPVINMGSELAGTPTVEVDNYQGMFSLMQHMLRRRPDASILFISGPVVNEDNKLRLAALRSALSELGRELSDDQILIGDYTSHAAKDLFIEYLNTVDKPAELVVCSNDLSAKGVLDALQDTDWSCPDDLWVTGYDDFEYAAFVMPGLTTVHFPATQLGRKGAELSLALLAGEEVPMMTTVSGYPVYRGSTSDAHPGIGDHQKNLLSQWQLLQQRDNNSLKLKVLRNVNRRQPLQDFLISIHSALMDLDVSHLSVFIRDIAEDGTTGFTEYSASSIIRHPVGEGRLLPADFLNGRVDRYWVFCALEEENEHYGFLVAGCAPHSAEFIDFLTPQLAEMLHTEALEKRNERYRLQNELNERMASLGSLVSGVAHEINTPVGNGKLAASSLLSIMQEIKHHRDNNTLTKSAFDSFIKECDEYAGIIYQSLDRAASLISNFKMVSVDQTAEEKRLFDLGEYIESVLISLRHQLKGTNIQLLTELDEGVLVDTFPGAVAQVITNLFMNALKHGFDHATLRGEIHIRLKREARGFRLEVSDTGAGASENVLNHIFDPFFTTRRGKGGSGLGMHIVYNLLSQKLDWAIELVSAPGEGFAAFIFPNTKQRTSA